jgi:ParB/RepB/Spo0J family partition protein
MPQATNFKTLSESRKDMFLIPLEELKIQEGFNVREDYGDIDELAKSLVENGQLEPLTIRSGEDGSIIIVNGHRRIKAFVLAKEKYGSEIKSAWCIPENKGANEETRIIDLFIRNNGKPLTIIEQASVIKRLVDYNWTITDISKKIGKSRVYVGNVLSLHSAPKEVRDVVKEGIISPTAGVKLAQAPKAKQTSVLQKIQELYNDPVGENKTDTDTPKKKKKVSAAVIEKEVKGETSMISSRSIKDIIKKINDIISELKSDSLEGDSIKDLWKAVQYGLELALGKKDLDPKKF